MAERPAPSSVLQALALPRQGRVFELDSGWWRHMPTFDGYPQFEVVTYNSPRGERLDARGPFDPSVDNEVEWGFVSELVSLGLHTGTHIDALSHITVGPNDEWHGGVRASEAVGDYGPIRDDASVLPPILGRGILLDIPGLFGLDALPPHFAIQEEHVAGAADRAGVQIREGDIVLVRTGQMKYWPDPAAITEHCGGSGVDVSAARWIADAGASYLGADTLPFEVRPSNVPGNSLPVHTLLLHERGINILEWVYLEELAAQGVSEFLFIALPLTIKGGTGSPIRPLAIV